ncbi:DNA damage-inducible protein DinB [Croceivirga lutea]|uniref:DinB family protein n=1 Tax=Croceivirga lutea TaxID=1775167 RepID=UPI00163AB474|nr:DinB family protein [Croceivirga lutea]GGG39621.1 DNA damage-inducible protein DinB [Croceivirga lutea]
MEKTVNEVITKDQLLKDWQAHRRLTRKVIEAFPEKEFFNYSIGGMRPFSEMAMELLGIAEPGLREIVTGISAELNEQMNHENKKQNILEAWDNATQKINAHWEKIDAIDFNKEIMSFGQFPGTVQSALAYFIENEIHHRGQGYVYLRSLGIEPPLFYERD